ncbi:MAG: wax ester/triacylglycerol synthase family O-acyltransferase [Myxococcales bacterium]|nr:wax ester/triacylglycerol synthase family O-acyltransferase [Myxococcales bacterium]
MGHYERLSMLDASFLEIESDAAHMHVGAVILFESGPLEREHGGIDYELIKRYVEASIQRVPRYRQRLGHVPMLKHPVWVDDDRFVIDYHVRHAGLPKPGSLRQLKRLAGRIFSQKLDRGRPLWEFWVVEGLEGDRFAVITKVHHCMIDGISGVDLIAALLRTNRDDRIPAIEPWAPRPLPTPQEILEGEVKHRFDGQLALFDSIRRALDDPTEFVEKAQRVVQGLAETIGVGLLPASHSPLDTQRLGPNRRFDWCSFPLERVKRLKNDLGGTVNDVVLTTVAGALRRFFERRGSDPREIVDYRALIPVNVRSRTQRGTLGNKVSMILCPLPIHIYDPRQRFEFVAAETEKLKASSKNLHANEIAEELGDLTGAGLVARAIQLAIRFKPYNITVTNVPGPPFPLYILGARLQAIYPMVPLFGDQSVGIALFSYDAKLFWGFSADWQLVPDLHELIEDMREAFEELERLTSETAHPDAP